MGLNQTPSSERVHSGFFGRRNAGKSSVVNAVTGQELAVVSDVKGTTTDPVQKAMELLPLGPVVIIDTPGIDDEGMLGELRIKKTKQILNKTDLAVLVVDQTIGMTAVEEEVRSILEAKEIPYLIAWNKADLMEETKDVTNLPGISVSAKTGAGISELKEQMAHLMKKEEAPRPIVGDLLSPGDVVVLVTPIDESAPKGRLILPQQQTIRDILDRDATAIVTKETTIGETIANLKQPPRMVITDSQVFGIADAATPKDILLTSFSILFARYKGDLQEVVKGAAAIGRLKDGDKVLISEGCTHHRQCNDIGSVKLPNWLKKYTQKELEISFTSGTEFLEDISAYQLIIHCGGCMLNEREMKYRLKCAKDAMVPITNYGIAIAFMQGILERSLLPFPEILRYLKEE